MQAHIFIHILSPFHISHTECAKAVANSQIRSQNIERKFISLINANITTKRENTQKRTIDLILTYFRV